MRRFRTSRSVLVEAVGLHGPSKLVPILRLLTVLLAVSWPYAVRAQGDILRKVRAEHPRLIFTQAEWEKLRDATKKDPVKSSWFEQLRRAAETQMQRPKTNYRLENNQF